MESVIAIQMINSESNCAVLCFVRMRLRCNCATGYQTRPCNKPSSPLFHCRAWPRLNRENNTFFVCDRVRCSKRTTSGFKGDLLYVSLYFGVVCRLSKAPFTVDFLALSNTFVLWSHHYRPLWCCLFIRVSKWTMTLARWPWVNRRLCYTLWFETVWYCFYFFIPDRNNSVIFWLIIFCTVSECVYVYLCVNLIE